MRAALRDAKIADAKLNRPKQKRVRIQPHWGWPPQAEGIPWPGKQAARARRRAGRWRKE